MSDISISDKGDFKQTRDFLNKMLKGDLFSDFDHYGRMGVDALTHATPIDSGLTEHSWGYRITNDSFGPGIEWFNTNMHNGVSIVILIQYGHGTGNGGYISGRDFINPAIQPLFDQIVSEIWKKVIA